MDLFDLLSHPLTLAFANHALTTRGTRETYDERMRRLEQQLDQIGTARPTPAAAAQPGPVAAYPSPVSPSLLTTTAPASIAAVRDELGRSSGALKEALRFAREDGMAHPEVRKRLGDVSGWLTDLERYRLAPERLGSMPPEQRQAVEALLPELRRLRQNVCDVDTNETRVHEVGDLNEVAAQAGRLATQLAAAAALTTTAKPYSNYAPDMSLDTGCLPCGTAHWAGVDTTLRVATDVARQRGFADPDVQGRRAQAQEELEVLNQYDWTPERIAAAPPADKEILHEFAPRAQKLLEDVRSVSDVDSLTRVASEAATLREEYRQAMQGRTTAEGGASVA